MHWSQRTPSSNNIRDYSTMDITRWSIPKSDWLYSLQPKMEKLYTVSKNKIWSSLWLRSWQLITKFRLKLKKVGKTTKPFRYDLNQIPYDYTVEVRNRFKGLDPVDLIRRAWRTMDGGSQYCTGGGDQNNPQRKNAKRQNGCLRRPYKQLRKEEKLKAKEKGKDISNWLQTSRE